MENTKGKQLFAEWSKLTTSRNGDSKSQLYCNKLSKEDNALLRKEIVKDLQNRFK